MSIFKYLQFIHLNFTRARIDGQLPRAPKYGKYFKLLTLINSETCKTYQVGFTKVFHKKLLYNKEKLHT